MTERINLGKTKDAIELPNLIQCQLSSFDEFKERGIDEILKEIFPIEDANGVYELNYLTSTMGEPKISPEESRKKGLTYSAPLKATFRLINKDVKDVQESDVFLGDFPFMTEQGTFVYNGIERVVVNQIVRSPGIYFDGSVDAKGRQTYSAKIIPYNGAWVSFETDSRGLIWVRVDSSKKISVTVFLKAIGLGNNADILRIFNNHELIMNTLEKDPTTDGEEALLEFYKKVRPNDPPVIERAQNYIETTFFNNKRYDLAPVGRYKLNKKLALRQRVLKKTLAEDATGVKAGTVMNDEILSSLAGTEGLFIETKDGKKAKVIGNGTPETKCLTLEDFVAAINYLINLDKGIGDVDNIDHLANRRIRLVGELLQGQFRKGMQRVEKFARERMSVSQLNKDEGDTVTPGSLIHIKPLMAVIKEFLGSGQLSQFVEQINPLNELNNKRRVSALGQGGIQKDRAGVDVRDVHYSHYGKICPIETPEGQSVGLIGSMATYSRVNSYGFFETPYRKVVNGVVLEEIEYLTADDEEKYYIAQASEKVENGKFLKDRLIVRYGKEYPTVSANEVDYIDVSSKQIVGVGASLIPFLEHDDANRAQMGANMQRQGVPLINPDEPLIGTGMEGKVAVDTQAAYVADGEGVVKNITRNIVEIEYKNGEVKEYKINKYTRSNANTCFNHYVRVVKGQKLQRGDVIADGTSANSGELALGKNLTVAFMPWEGYNFEDAVLLSERVVKEDALTTIMITEHTIEVRDTKIGAEVITKEVPNTGERQRENLDEEGIVRIGSKVGSNDILVGKTTPKSQEETSAEERLINAIFGEKAKDWRDTSLRLPNGKSGTVIDIVRLTKENSELKNGVLEEIKVYVAQKRKIVRGDKMAGRHGNKGVVSKILPEEDMPHLPDGTPVDVCLNPLGVPSRMNIGQVMETHLGMVAKALGVRFTTPVFDGVGSEFIQEKLKESKFPESGKFDLYDGRTGEKFENPVTVGVMYMMKLNHQVYDKIHARATGPYSLVTQQPLGGKAQFGGQRFGEMEVWALEAHGAAYTLQEMLTLKSDDVFGRAKLFEAIVKGGPFPEPNIPESFKVLMNEIRGLGLDIDAVATNGQSLIRKKKKKAESEDE